MKDLLRKAILTGIGISLLTRDKIEEFGKKVAAESKLGEEEGEKFINDIIFQSEKSRSEFNENVKKSVSTVLMKIDIPSREEILLLEKRILDLENSHTE